MRPLISIVVPVYNAGSYLVPCLESLLAQTYRPLEIILVEDHSTDGSREVCRQYEENHSLIRVCDGEHKGANAARWLGITKAKGEFVLCSDSDDLAHPQLIEGLYHGICVSGLPCSCCRYDTFMDGTVPQDAEKYPDGVLLLAGNKHLDSLMHDKRIDWGLYNKLYMKDFLLEQAFLTGFTYNEDLLANWCLFKTLPGVALLPEFIGYHYRQHNASLSRKPLNEKLIKDQLAIAELIASDCVGTELEQSGNAFLYEKLLYLISLIYRQSDDKPFTDILKAMRARVKAAYPLMKKSPYLSRSLHLAAYGTLYLTFPYRLYCRTFLDKR